MWPHFIVRCGYDATAAAHQLISIHPVFLDCSDIFLVSYWKLTRREAGTLFRDTTIMSVRYDVVFMMRALKEKTTTKWKITPDIIERRLIVSIRKKKITRGKTGSLIEVVEEFWRCLFFLPCYNNGESIEL